MRKIIPILLMLLFVRCNKHDNPPANNQYYCSFQNDDFTYTMNIDSLISIKRFSLGLDLGAIEIAKGTTGAQKDSAINGLIPLSTFFLDIYNDTVVNSSYIGTYTNDTSANNSRILSPVTYFNIYTKTDSKNGRIWMPTHGLPFTLTVNEITQAYIAGTFQGKLIRLNNPLDTMTIANGKFKLPF